MCLPCEKFINIGQPILECENCDTAIHTKCYKASKFSCPRGLWVCETCSKNVQERYDPFPTKCTDIHSDKFYDDDGSSEDNLLQAISLNLEKCKLYTAKELRHTIMELTGPEQVENHNTNSSSTSNFLSSLFYNIDGNATNFDAFLAKVKHFQHNFPIIGLAETNTDEELKDLYKIPMYCSFYQSTLKGKSKGTGVALYVHESLTAEVLENVSHCDENIEYIS